MDAEFRDRLIESHLPLAHSVARRFAGRGVDYDDLFQVASLALVKAVDRFDEARGLTLATFAVPTMIGEVRNYFRDKAFLFRIPRSAASIRQAEQKLLAKLGRMPCVQELAEAVHMPEEDLLLTLDQMEAFNVTSLDDEESEFDPGESEEGYEAFERSDAIERAMPLLSERQQQIVRLRFYKNLSQREVAEIMEISQMTVSREERRALEVLRKGITGT